MKTIRPSTERALYTRGAIIRTYSVIKKIVIFFLIRKYMRDCLSTPKRGVLGLFKENTFDISKLRVNIRQNKFTCLLQQKRKLTLTIKIYLVFYTYTRRLLLSRDN